MDQTKFNDSANLGTREGTVSLDKVKVLEAISAEVRRSVFETILHAQSGHLGASSSSVELMVSLYFGGILNYDQTNPKNPDRDRVLIRGHVGPLRYRIFSLIGWIPEEELMTYRQLGSKLQGHESMDLVPGVDITPSGSLGMVLSYGAGSALAAKAMHKNFKTYVFLGDGEEQEGNVSEAARHISNMNLDNIVVILDKNKKQLSGPTLRVDSGGDVRKIWECYGWNVVEIKNGNSIPNILDTFANIKYIKRPTLVIANTTKGLGIIGAEENFCGYHTISSCPTENLEKSLS
jgi:transketolase